MFEFEVIQELKSNAEVLDFIKNYEYTVKSGKSLDSKEQMF